jgi:hypothetical protein
LCMLTIMALVNHMAHKNKVNIFNIVTD